MKKQEPTESVDMQCDSTKSNTSARKLQKPAWKTV